MSDDQRQLLALLGHLPARLTAEQTAWLLNCQPYDIAVLIAARLLKPLGDPGPNSRKYFAAVEIASLMRNQPWLHRVTRTLQEYWSHRNRRPDNGEPGCVTVADFPALPAASARINGHRLPARRH